MEDRRCATCGDLFTPRRATAKFCSEECRPVRLRRHRRVCAECGLEYVGRRTATCEACYYDKRGGRERAAKYYATKGKARRSTWAQQRLEHEPRPCVACGQTFTPTRKDQRGCSPECRSAIKRGAYRRPTGTCEWCGGVWVAAPGGRARYQRFCSPRCRGWGLTKVLSSPLGWQPCDECGRPFVQRRGAKRCSAECRSAAAKRAANRYVDKRDNSERIMRLYRLAVKELDIPKASMWRRVLTDHLARRDGPNCAICHNPVDLELPSGPRGHKMGPSIDHIIPVSQGGPDEMTNVRLTHWICNNKRGNRGGNEQLRLIA